MKNKFLPKALDGSGGTRACFDLGRGVETTEPHFHDCTEIVYMKKGDMRVFLDCEWLTLKEGEALLVPAGYVHSTVCDDADAERAVIGFYDSLISDFNSEEGHGLLPFLSVKFNTGSLILSKNVGNIEKSFEKLIALPSLSGKGNILLLYSEIISIYYAFYSSWDENGLLPNSLKISKTAVAVEEYVKFNFHLPISAKEVAKKMNVSYSYMARLLSESFGYGFSELLLLTRTDAAKKLLMSTDKSVTDVGFECGFSTTSAFIQTFRQKTGKTPLAYRKATKIK